ncbi:MAG: alkaline phosphatase family protein [Candidatus Limnocylindrales bacterium]
MLARRPGARWMGALVLLLSAAVGACGSPNVTASPAPTNTQSATATMAAATSTPTTATPTPTPSGTASPTPSPSPKPGTVLPNFSHVYLIIMENKEYGSIVGTTAAPYINGLIARYGMATNLYAETHPSEPNYIALTSGGLQGTSTDGSYDLSVTNLFDQVEASGRTWHVYAQGYPGKCFEGSLSAGVVDGPGAAGEYVRKHNPAISYKSINQNLTRCANITKLAGFDPAAADFEMIVPNLINDMHSSSVGAGDAFLKAFVPQIVGSPAFANSVLFITWDEGSSSLKGGGHIATVIVSPGMTPGSRFTGAASHYSILRTIELAWGMPLLGAAATASTITLPY